MPGMDGFSLAQLINGNTSLAHPTMVMISSAARPGDAQRCRDVGVARYMTKPVIKSELLDTILEALDEHADDAIHDKRTPEKQPMGPSLSILLVEDGLVNQRVAVGFLERAGHKVTVAENGEVALQHWGNQPFDVILMDVQMPVMDGLDATCLIREREAKLNRHTPIIAMTAAAMKGDRERCLEVGMDDYISKPIAPNVLFATIAKYVDTASASEPTQQQTTQPASIEGDPKKIVDFDQALTQVPGGIEVLQDLANIFLAECPKLMKDLRQGLADNDAELAQRAAHTVKGAARILAANQLIEISAELELAAKEGQLDVVQARVEEIATAVDRACHLIRQWQG